MPRRDITNFLYALRTSKPHTMAFWVRRYGVHANTVRKYAKREGIKILKSWPRAAEL